MSEIDVVKVGETVDAYFLWCLAVETDENWQQILSEFNANSTGAEKDSLKEEMKMIDEIVNSLSILYTEYLAKNSRES